MLNVLFTFLSKHEDGIQARAEACRNHFCNICVTPLDRVENIQQELTAAGDGSCSVRFKFFSLCVAL